MFQRQLKQLAARLASDPSSALSIPTIPELKARQDDIVDIAVGPRHIVVLLKVRSPFMSAISSLVSVFSFGWAALVHPVLA